MWTRGSCSKPFLRFDGGVRMQNLLVSFPARTVLFVSHHKGRAKLSPFCFVLPKTAGFSVGASTFCYKNLD